MQFGAFWCILATNVWLSSSTSMDNLLVGTEWGVAGWPFLLHMPPSSKMFVRIQLSVVEMIQCSKHNKYNSQHENHHSLRTLKPLGNAVWHKILSVTSSFAEWKLMLLVWWHEGHVVWSVKVLSWECSWLTMTAWWQRAVSKSGTLSLSQHGCPISFKPGWGDRVKAVLATITVFLIYHGSLRSPVFPSSVYFKLTSIIVLSTTWATSTDSHLVPW